MLRASKLTSKTRTRASTSSNSTHTTGQQGSKSAKPLRARSKLSKLIQSSSSRSITTSRRPLLSNRSTTTTTTASLSTTTATETATTATTTSPAPTFFTAPHTNPTYITNPIFYVNGAPHIGHLYTSLVSETLRSWKRTLGNDTFVMGGTDEHGIKVQEAAEKAGYTSIQSFCDDISTTFSSSWNEFDLSPDSFHRTTSPQHAESVQWMWKQLARNGYIYLGKHSGWYCKSDETFVPETQLIKQDDGAFKTASGHEVIWVEEENFKFQISHFLEPLAAFYRSFPSTVVPSSQLNAVLGQIEDLDDISISRLGSKLKWGIDVPTGDDVQYWNATTKTYTAASDITKEAHKVYVWLDALNIYVTAARDAAKLLKMNESGASDGQTNESAPNDAKSTKTPLIFSYHNPTTQTSNLFTPDSFYSFHNWFESNPHQATNQHFADKWQSEMAPVWPPSMHIIGKDILKFHALYWPAFLIGAGLPLPKQVVSHSHWMVEGRKMSKSLGNVVSPQLLKDTLGTEGAKYAIIRLGAIGEDNDFIMKNAIDLTNSELSDTIGNLAMRCTGKAVLPTGKYLDPLRAYRGKNAQNAQNVPAGVNGGMITDTPFAINTKLALEHGVIGEDEIALEAKMNGLKHEFDSHFSALRPDRAFASVIDLGIATNVYFSNYEPWKMAKTIKELSAAEGNGDNVDQNAQHREQLQKKLDTVLYYSVEATRICSLFLRVIVPQSADVILDQLGFPKEGRAVLLDPKSHTFGWHPSLDPQSLHDNAHVSVVPFQKIKPPVEPKANESKGKKGGSGAKKDKGEKKVKETKDGQAVKATAPETAANDGTNDNTSKGQ